MKTILIIFLVAAIALADDSDDKSDDKSGECGKHAFYPECGSGCGDLNCEVRSFEAVLCPAACVKGCFCKDGYVRGPKGTCIRPCKCPVCPPNEHYKHCGTACERTCENRFTKHLCPDQCVSKCFCDGDLVRDVTGNCVSEDQCPQ